MRLFISNMQWHCSSFSLDLINHMREFQITAVVHCPEETTQKVMIVLLVYVQEIVHTTHVLRILLVI